MPSMLAENILTENLLSLNAVSFLTEEPLRLRSGLVTPIYIDNRMLIAHPDAWHDVIETMASLIEKWGLEYDVIAGVEAGGLTHSAALAYRLFRPTIYVRQNAKTLASIALRRLSTVIMNASSVASFCLATAASISPLKVARLSPSIKSLSALKCLASHNIWSS